MAVMNPQLGESDIVALASRMHELSFHSSTSFHWTISIGVQQLRIPVVCDHIIDVATSNNFSICVHATELPYNMSTNNLLNVILLFAAI